MKILNIIIFCLCIVSTAQVGVNTINPQSTLDVSGANSATTGSVDTSDGILVPRVTDLAVNGSQESQLIYLVANWTNDMGTPTTVDDIIFAEGFYYWNTTVTRWTPLDTDTNGPWNTALTNTPSTNNSENIYTRGQRVGIGTNNPLGILHLSQDNQTSDVLFVRFHPTPSNDLDLDFLRSLGTQAAPALLTDNTRIGGLRAQSITNPSAFTFSNAAEIAFESDGASSSNNSPGKIIFGTAPTGTTSTIDRMVIKNNGNVGINENVPNSTLDIEGSVSMRIRTLNSGTISDNDYTILATGSLSLPAAAATNLGRIYNIVNHTTNTISISGTISINGNTQSNYDLNNTNNGRAITVQSNGTSWILISRY